MTCQQIAEFLMSYLDGELTLEQRTHFEEHLQECPDCVAYLQTYRETIRLSKAAYGETTEVVLQGIPEDLVKAILAARTSD